MYRTESLPSSSRVCVRRHHLSVMSLAVSLAVVVVVFEEEVLEAAVRRESHRRDTQTRECALESTPPAEEACVSPFLTVAGAGRKC